MLPKEVGYSHSLSLREWLHEEDIPSTVDGSRHISPVPNGSKYCIKVDLI